jgi:hypothetical protein
VYVTGVPSVLVGEIVKVGEVVEEGASVGILVCVGLGAVVGTRLGGMVCVSVGASISGVEDPQAVTVAMRTRAMSIIELERFNGIISSSSVTQHGRSQA